MCVCVCVCVPACAVLRAAASSPHRRALHAARCARARRRGTSASQPPPRLCRPDESCSGHRELPVTAALCIAGRAMRPLLRHSADRTGVASIDRHICVFISGYIDIHIYTSTDAHVCIAGDAALGARVAAEPAQLAADDARPGKQAWRRPASRLRRAVPAHAVAAAPPPPPPSPLPLGLPT
jgi:hypothetical protein